MAPEIEDSRASLAPSTVTLFEAFTLPSYFSSLSIGTSGGGKSEKFIGAMGHDSTCRRLRQSLAMSALGIARF